VDCECPGMAWSGWSEPLQAQPIELFIEAGNLQWRCILPEGLVAVGADCDNFLDSAGGELRHKLTEAGGKECLPTQVVRGFQAAVKDDPHCGIVLLQELVASQDMIRPDRRQGAAGEEHCVAIFRQVSVTKQSASAGFLVTEQSPVLPQFGEVVADSLSAKLKKHPVRLQVFGTRGGTETTEAALVGELRCYCCGGSRLITLSGVALGEGGGQLTWSTFFL